MQLHLPCIQSPSTPITSHMQLTFTASHMQLTFPASHMQLISVLAHAACIDSLIQAARSPGLTYAAEAKTDKHRKSGFSQATHHQVVVQSVWQHHQASRLKATLLEVLLLCRLLNSRTFPAHWHKWETERQKALTCSLGARVSSKQEFHKILPAESMVCD